MRLVPLTAGAPPAARRCGACCSSLLQGWPGQIRGPLCPHSSVGAPPRPLGWLERGLGFLSASASWRFRMLYTTTQGRSDRRSQQTPWAPPCPAVLCTRSQPGKGAARHAAAPFAREGPGRAPLFLPPGPLNGLRSVGLERLGLWLVGRGLPPAQFVLSRTQAHGAGSSGPLRSSCRRLRPEPRPSRPFPAPLPGPCHSFRSVMAPAGRAGWRAQGQEGGRRARAGGLAGIGPLALSAPPTLLLHSAPASGRPARPGRANLPPFLRACAAFMRGCGPAAASCPLA